MNFLAPFAFFFAAAIPVVIAFYLLKRKRVVKLVSSTLLWQKFLAETQASAPFQRLRHNWLLILQLLMLILVICALARPYFSGQSKSRGSAPLTQEGRVPDPGFVRSRAAALPSVIYFLQEERDRTEPERGTGPSPLRSCASTIRSVPTRCA